MAIKIQKDNEEFYLNQNLKLFEKACNEMNVQGINIDNLGVSFILGFGPPANEVLEASRYEFKDPTKPTYKQNSFLFSKRDLKTGRDFVIHEILELIEDYDRNYCLSEAPLKKDPYFKYLIQRIKEQIKSFNSNYQDRIQAHNDKMARNVIADGLKRARSHVALGRIEELFKEEFDFLQVKETMEK